MHSAWPQCVAGWPGSTAECTQHGCGVDTRRGKGGRLWSVVHDHTYQAHEQTGFLAGREVTATPLALEQLRSIGTCRGTGLAGMHQVVE